MKKIARSCKKCPTKIIIDENGNEKTLKQCTSCKEFLSLDKFHASKFGTLGKSAYCKDCDSERKGHQYRIKTATPVLIIEDDRILVYKKCTECEKIKPIDEFQNVKTGLFGKNSKCWDCLKKMWIEYNDNHIEERKKYNKKYLKDNKERIKLKDHNRRARVKQLPFTLTYEQYLEIMKEWKYVCALTGEQTNLTLDHFIPITKGGGTTYENILPLVGYLNSSKNNQNPLIWFEKNKERFNLSERKFNKIIENMAKKNKMTKEEYIEYINNIFETSNMGK